MSLARAKQVAGSYDAAQDILHLWFPEPVHLKDATAIARFFAEVTEDWLKKTQRRVYLLVNYRNLHIAPQVAGDYAANIGQFQEQLLGTFRYAVPQDFTGVAVTIGNLKLQAPANLFESEAEARAAIEEVRRHAAASKNPSQDRLGLGPRPRVRK